MRHHRMQCVHVLSPHRDDAVFSLFFALCEWSAGGVRLKVTNFFTHSAYAPHTHVSDAGAITAIRKREDRSALAKISHRIRVRDCGLIDAPLRLGIPASRVFYTEANERDIESVAGSMRGTANGLTLVPLGLGGHVDHITVRRAATLATPANQLAFYEDLPYAMWSEAQLHGILAEIQRILGRRLSPRILRSRCSVFEKRAAAARYRSQITAEEANAMAAWSRRYGVGERIWFAKPGIV